MLDHNPPDQEALEAAESYERGKVGSFTSRVDSIEHLTGDVFMAIFYKWSDLPRSAEEELEADGFSIRKVNPTSGARLKVMIGYDE